MKLPKIILFYFIIASLCVMDVMASKGLISCFSQSLTVFETFLIALPNVGLTMFLAMLAYNYFNEPNS